MRILAGMILAMAIGPAALADEVVETLSRMYPGTTFQSKPSESDKDFFGPGMLLHVTSPDAISARVPFFAPATPPLTGQSNK